MSRRTPENVEQAKRLRGEGMTWERIGAILKAAPDTVHGWAEEDYERRRRASVNKNRNRTKRRDDYLSISDRGGEPYYPPKRPISLAPVPAPRGGR